MINQISKTGFVRLDNNNTYILLDGNLVSLYPMFFFSCLDLCPSPRNPHCLPTPSYTAIYNLDLGIFKKQIKSVYEDVHNKILSLAFSQFNQTRGKITLTYDGYDPH